VDAPKDSSGSDSNKFKALDYPVFETLINEQRFILENY